MSAERAAAILAEHRACPCGCGMCVTCAGDTPIAAHQADMLAAAGLFSRVDVTGGPAIKDEPMDLVYEDDPPEAERLAREGFTVPTSFPPSVVSKVKP